ncbi:MAG: hypothetical protein WBP41_09040, partial [Saprospiraceae bacterium]
AQTDSFYLHSVYPTQQHVCLRRRLICYRLSSNLLIHLVSIHLTYYNHKTKASLGKFVHLYVLGTSPKTSKYKESGTY